jgi:hypothetical protein
MKKGEQKLLFSFLISLFYFLLWLQVIDDARNAAGAEAVVDVDNADV